MKTAHPNHPNMLRIFLPFLFTFICCTESYAQYENLISPTTVTSITYFEVGETKKYHVTETQEKYKNNAEKPIQSTSNSYDLTFKVVAATDSSYTIDMTYSNLQSGVATQQKGWKMDDLTAGLSNLMNNMTVRYKTDEMGAFDTIINLPELSLKMGKAFDLLKVEFNKLIDEKEKDKTANAEAKKMVNGMFAKMRDSFTKVENVEVLFLDDLIAMHSIYGFEMTLNKPDELEIYYNLFDSHSVLGVGKITLTAINKAADECKIDVTEQPDKEEMKAFMVEFVNSIMPEASEEKLSPSDFKIDASTKFTYIMSLTSGWMKKVTYTNKNNVTAEKNTSKTIKKKEYKLL